MKRGSSPSVFLSWTRVDAGEGPHALATALSAEGVDVWIDDHSIETFAPITSTIQEGLSSSNVFVAWYSEGYASRRACREELTLALLAAMRADQGPLRVLVVNPEMRMDHILEAPLLDQHFAGPDDIQSRGMADLARRIAARARDIREPFGALPDGEQTRWYGGAGWQGGSADFVGRLTEVWQLYDHLHRSSELTGGRAARQLAYVSGLGGVGKSLLAAEYAHRFAALYPGGVVWLNALGRDVAGDASLAEQSRAASENAMTNVAAWLGLDVSGASPLVIREAVKTHITESRRPTLWVVDDLPSGLSEEDVDEWRCPTPFTHELITSRDRSHVRLQPLLLGVLPAAEATMLVTAGRDLSEEEMTEAARLADELGNHPLACHVAGRFIVRTSTVSAYRQAVNRDVSRFDALAEQLAEQLPGDHTRLITATLATSLEHLGPSAWQLLRVATQLAPAPIPTSLIEIGLATRAGVAADSPHDQLRLLAEAVHDPRGDGLWEADAESVRVHVLVQSAAARLDPQPEAARPLGIALREALGARLSDAAPDIRRHPDVAMYAVHARHFVAAQLDESSGDESRAFVELALGRFDHEAGRYTAAKAAQEASLGALTRLRGEDDEWTLTAANDLGTTLRALGELRAAKELHQATYERRRRVLGTSHMHTQISANNLADAHAALGDLESARDLHRQTYEILQDSLGDRHPGTLASGNNLAGVLGDLGDLAAAQSLHRSTYEIRREVLGEDHPETLISAANLAETSRQLGDLTTARALNQMAYEAQLRVLGADHIDTQTTANNLALTLRELGDVDGALRIYESAYEVLCGALGRTHPATTTTGRNLAIARVATHDLTGAVELLRAVRQDAQDAEDQNGLLLTGDALAAVLDMQDETGLAGQVLAENLQLRRESLGEEHPETLRNALQLADHFLEVGDREQARPLYWRTWDGASRALGQEHPDTLRCAVGVARLLATDGAVGRLVPILREVLDARRRVLGPEHVETLQVLGLLRQARELYGPTWVPEEL